MKLCSCCSLIVLYFLFRKLGAQEAREKANADQLVNTDEKTKEYEKLANQYK